MGKKGGKRADVSADDLFAVDPAKADAGAKRRKPNPSKGKGKAHVPTAEEPVCQPADAEPPVEVEIDDDDLTGSAMELYEIASEELHGGGSDSAAVAQKLLEAALDKFRAEKAAGADSAAFLYYHAACMITIGAQMLVLDYITEGIGLLTDAVAKNTAAMASSSSSSASSDKAEVSTPDILGSLALAFADKARVLYMQDDDDDDDDAETVVAAALASSEEHHTRCIGLLTTDPEKVERILGLSRALLQFAQELGDDDDVQKLPLHSATEKAKAAAALAPANKACWTQAAACTICKANQAKEAEDDEREYTLLKEAIAELEKGLGNTDNDEEAQALQLLAGVLIRQAEMEDDEQAEELIGKAATHFAAAAKLQPDNEKLARMAEMMSG